MYALMEYGNITPEATNHFKIQTNDSGTVIVPLFSQGGRRIGHFAAYVDCFDPPVSRLAAKSLVRNAPLYHWDQITGRVSDIMLVFGVRSVWRMWEAGFPNTVGLLSQFPSNTHLKYIDERLRSKGRIWVFTDKRSAHRFPIETTLRQLSNIRDVHHVHFTSQTIPSIASDRLQLAPLSSAKVSNLD